MMSDYSDWPKRIRPKVLAEFTRCNRCHRKRLSARAVAHFCGPCLKTVNELPFISGSKIRQKLLAEIAAEKRDA